MNFKSLFEFSKVFLLTSEAPSTATETNDMFRGRPSRCTDGAWLLLSFSRSLCQPRIPQSRDSPLNLPSDSVCSNSHHNLVSGSGIKGKKTTAVAIRLLYKRKLDVRLLYSVIEVLCVSWPSFLFPSSCTGTLFVLLLAVTFTTTKHSSSSFIFILVADWPFCTYRPLNILGYQVNQKAKLTSR